MPFVIAYPMIDPVLVSVGPFPIRWYALAYIAGLVLGWAYAHYLVRKPALWGGARAPTPPASTISSSTPRSASSSAGASAMCCSTTCRFILANPLAILQLWQGGMSFHGGFAGTALAVALLARARGISVLRLYDVVCAVAPIGIFLGRIANFIKPELWGRPTDVAWAMIFPGAGPLPRHPSQLYEAALEGLALFLVLFVAVRLGALRRPGLVTGIFAVGYGAARIASEFFREPDPQLGFLFGGATMGMLLSLPMIAVGGLFIGHALRTKAALA